MGQSPEQQIHDSLRAFKRLMEAGELLSSEGQNFGSTETGE
jgi:uncharacterized membrane protein